MANYPVKIICSDTLILAFCITIKAAYIFTITLFCCLKFIGLVSKAFSFLTPKTRPLIKASFFNRMTDPTLLLLTLLLR